MKVIAISMSCLLAVCVVFAADSCYKDVTMECSQLSSNLVLSECNALYADYGGHDKVYVELNAYANLHLELSFQYLLSASYFNNYKTNRAGFSKLFSMLSHKAWRKTISLIKHITMRGGKIEFNERSSQVPADRNSYKVEVTELEALARALDTQKMLAERAFSIHREATRNLPRVHDSDITAYLETEFIEGQSKIIRDLAGYTNDLKKFIVDKGQDLSIGLYFMDEYLRKTV